jgi:hypothetical protein
LVLSPRVVGACPAVAFGVGAGLISVADGKAVAEAGLDMDAIEDGELLDRWLAGDED